MWIQRLALTVLASGLCLGPLDAFAAQRNAARALPFNIAFDDHCDGMDLMLSDRGSAVGFHTGCDAGEFLMGTQFQTDKETGVTITFFERASGLYLRYDIYRTGFRAGRFYAYAVLTNELVRSSTYTEVQ